MDNLKRIVDHEEVGKVLFELNHLYTAGELVNKINEGISQTPGNYILFDCDSQRDPSEVYMNIITAREETDDEFNDRMLRDKSAEDALILRREKVQYIEYLSLKAKFENK